MSRLAFLLVPVLLAAGPPPATVTFDRPPADPREAATITKQAGVSFAVDEDVKFVGPPPAAGKYTLWEAADALADATGRPLTFAVESGRLGLGSPRPEGVPAAAVSRHGRFRVAARRVIARIDLETGRAFTDVELDVWWEPRTRVYLLDAGPTVAKAEDDRGRPLRAVAPSGGRDAAVGHGATLTARLAGVPRDAARIAVLEGSIGIVAADRTLSVPFDDVETARTKPVETTVDGVRLTLAANSAVDGVVAADVTVRYPKELPTFESFQSWLPANRCRLIPPGDGKELAPFGYDVNRQDETSAAATYRFRVAGLKANDPLKGWRLVYETPAAIDAFAVPFTLRGLPLP